MLDHTPSFSIVGIGASAGGLEACKALIDAMPPITGLAFVLIQHLDPDHASMMVDLLSGRSALTIVEAAEGMPIECEHLYTMPADAFLAVKGGYFRLSRPTRHGVRLPFDFFLRAVAVEYGPRAICVVLSGSGVDGSLGVAAVKAAGGFCIVQDPNDAGHGGMPRGAIDTGLVDQVLLARDIPRALVTHTTNLAYRRLESPDPQTRLVLDEIIALLRLRTSADFSTYKRGTLQRRIERRMALTNTDDMASYLGKLCETPTELHHLAKDLLIHTTGFFRDRDVFAKLQQTVIPDLLRGCVENRTVRVWVAGCSTGEETYSLAMLLRERITAEKLDVKLQIFASDIDRDAIASAREGAYPIGIGADVSSQRLSRFFTLEDQRYRIAPELRASVVFTVHDVLSDPPFSRLDMISCRNLLIYFLPPAQAKVLSLFHFALKSEGILLLGTAETVGRASDRFEMLSAGERIYRKVGPMKVTDLDLLQPSASGTRALASKLPPSKPQPGLLADLCRRAVLDTYAPAAVLVNARNECVYHLGPTETYLRIAPGLANHDILEMSRHGTRTRLRSTIERVRNDKTRLVVGGGRTSRQGRSLAFDIAVQPVADGDLLLICFLDKSVTSSGDRSRPHDEDPARVLELERELEATRSDLQGAISDLETSSEDQKAINEEALSFNEEYQSTNEELVTSKEELQSYNEELTALNGQLQETLEKQRTTSNDLQNVLYSTNVATLFLDMDLKIRFFTPATRAVFKVIPGDIGRPLADLQSYASDVGFADDVREVLKDLAPREREIEGRTGDWFHRCILPYRGHNGTVEGIVITFTDMTGRKHDAQALESAKRLAEQATSAKSRFLAAASHDLRQPLQTLSLIRGLLAKTAKGDGTEKLVAGLEETLSAMSGMLDTLLDVNQIEAGIVRPTVTRFVVQGIFGRLRDEFAYSAKAHRLELRVVDCSLEIESDQHLLEQMVRNLVSNALKYTTRGKVLLGCRRRGDIVRLEIWDTGAGIPLEDLQVIFDEYHQLENSARERSRGLGLGLSIVQSLAKLLGHEVRVRSTPGRGSVFSIDVRRQQNHLAHGSIPARTNACDGEATKHRSGSILVIEDDPEIRSLMMQLLAADGHRVAAACDGVEALAMVVRGLDPLDIILADYNLPNGMDGLEVAARIKSKIGRQIPVVILTGDISMGALREIAARDCLALNKPIQAETLVAALQTLLGPTRTAISEIEAPHGRRTLFVVDDDEDIRTWIRSVFEAQDTLVEDYPDSESFLAAYRAGRDQCVLIDAGLPGMSGAALLMALRNAGYLLPAIMITGHSDVAMAVGAMKAGASDFIEKPASPEKLLSSVKRALDMARDDGKRLAWQADAAGHLAALTTRQRQVMDLVLAGSASKTIAYELGISQRTVENHRASIMRKTGSTSLPALARLALAAGPA